MKTIKKGELYQNLSGFLKAKGIELKEGSYSHRIQQGCELLAGAVNATQRTAKRAKVQVNKKLDQLRGTIHKATAPQAPETKPPPSGAGSKPNSPLSKATLKRTKPRRRK